MKSLLNCFKVKRLSSFYARIFSLKEIENQVLLVWVFGAMLFGFFNTFNQFISVFQHSSKAVEMGEHICWPHWQGCGDFSFFTGLPWSYGQSTWYMALFGIMILVVYALAKKRWIAAHGLMSILWLWKFFFVCFFSMAHMGNYDYYHLAFTFVLLFLPHKVFFLKFLLVWFYFLSTAIKIHEGWTLGTYFSSLATGLPLFPDSTIPVWTNLVIGAEMILAWCLLWRPSIWQKLAFFFFVCFHLYSGILVFYHYPATVMPVLLILFGPWYTYTEVPTGWKTLGGWLIVLLFGIGQSISHLIPGDEKLTLEGNYYGLFMFEANHQCVSSIKIKSGNGEVSESLKTTQSARFRCDPYRYWFSIKNKYCDKEATSVEWTLDHSINGHSFYRIVDEVNACDLNYKPFGKNAWIKTPQSGAQKVGYPQPNYYY